MKNTTARKRPRPSTVASAMPSTSAQSVASSSSVIRRSRSASASRAISCDTVPAATSASAQMSAIAAMSRHVSAWTATPSAMKPSPRLSALVSACSRVKTSGKRSIPTAPAMKKNSPIPVRAQVA